MVRAIADAGYYALLLGGLGGFFWWKHRWERALSTRMRERAMAAGSTIDRSWAVDEPAVLLVPSGTAGFSKLGGAPDLPEGLGPPIGAGGGSRFVGQIELASARSAGLRWLPDMGAIYIFCDEVLHDEADFAKVMYGPVGRISSGDANGGRSAGTRVSLVPVRSFPSSIWLGLNDDFRASLQDVDSGRPVQNPAPHHQLGGYPDEIQNERLLRTCARAACALYSLPEEPGSWRLLVQVDSDPTLGLELGDGGRLFIFVRAADAKACDFSRTVSIWQSH